MSQSIVQVTRGGILESQHAGIIAVVGVTGAVIASYGDVGLVTFSRSSAKPLQAIPLLESGAFDYYGFGEPELALCCASHSSEPQHTERVAEMLRKIGLDENALQCGPHMPHSMETYDRLVKLGQPLTSLYSNCSGKHTGMLMYCKYTGADLSSYHHPEHPLQQDILRVISELTEVDNKEIVIGTDGCGVPAFGLPIVNWAKAFAKFVQPEAFPHGKAIERISRAIRQYPELIGGENRFDTDLMKATSGRILAKGGAEAFIVVSVLDAKLSFVVKILDGNSRAIPPVVIKTLLQLGVLSAEERSRLGKYERPQVVNTRSETVGEIEADFQLRFQ